MATTEELLTNLVIQRNTLADILTNRGIPSTHIELFDTLIRKTVDIHDVLTGTATPDKVVAGTTFYSNDSTIKQTGALSKYTGLPLLAINSELTLEIKAIVEDADYLYVASGQYIKKYSKPTLLLQATSPAFGGIINTLAMCSTGGAIYAAGATVFTIKMFETNGLTLIHTSPDYGGIVNTLKVIKNATGAGEYIYAAGSSGLIKKYYFDSYGNITLLATSATYGGIIYALDLDDDGFIYAAGATVFVVKKYDIETLTLRATSHSTATPGKTYGGIIYALAVDNLNNRVIAGGALSATNEFGYAIAYALSDLDEAIEIKHDVTLGDIAWFVTYGYGGAIYALSINNDYLFIGGSSTVAAVEWFSLVGEGCQWSPPYNGIVKAICACYTGNDTFFIFAGGTVSFDINVYALGMYMMSPNFFSI